jgi:LysM repeat protein
LGGSIIRAHPTIRGHRTRLSIGLAASVAVLTLAASHPAAGAPSAHDRYQVRRGDTLSGIAHDLGVSIHTLATANGIADVDLVWAGAWLKLPSGGSPRAARSPRGTPARTHTVKLGETLSDIAAHYGLATSTLAGANGITDPDLVIEGQKLKVPAVGTDGRGPSSLPRRLRQNPDRLALMGTFDLWATRYAVPRDLLKAVTWLESGWQNDVVSSTGALGIGQLMPSTVKTVNQLMGTHLNVFVASDNIRMSARYLRFLLDLTGGSAAKTLAGYYQGLASVARNGIYPSTLAYINGVTMLRRRFR